MSAKAHARTRCLRALAAALTALEGQRFADTIAHARRAEEACSDLLAAAEGVADWNEAEALAREVERLWTMVGAAAELGAKEGIGCS